MPYLIGDTHAVVATVIFIAVVAFKVIFGLEELRTGQLVLTIGVNGQQFRTLDDVADDYAARPRTIDTKVVGVVKGRVVKGRVVKGSEG